ncbi:tautomerase family protein [Dinoroseobacter sp. S76]|uniref:tautomerase family protein n=1 Tax=Dinoroseobacter sp. S76 TaxID=3415124 RepID=UPI003C7E1F48
MPFTRISLRRGKDAAYHAALRQGVFTAMRSTFDVPAEDRFIVIHEHDPSSFDFGPNYLDIARSEDLVMIQITANNTRSTAQKQAFYKAICDTLTRDPGLRPEDVFISLVEVAKENWSFGHGLAQYAEPISARDA